ncbi:gliding motility-associated C-terminal domain-containing protein [bacterium]|nr:gliding motility-associated C-terminal domain-containing protein [bacterium]
MLIKNRKTALFIALLALCSVGSSFAIGALVDTIPPTVKLVWPDTGAFVSCDFVIVEMVMTDDFLIDRESILLSVFAELGVHSVPESMVSIIDSFYYFPIRVPMFDGDTVDLLMNPVSDYMGNESPSFWFYFYSDMTGPVITDQSPAPGSEVPNPRPPISATLIDPAEIAIDSCTISIDDIEYPLGGEYVTWSGMSFTFRTDLAGLFFHGGDTVEVCVYAEDMAEGCGHNSSDSCWTFSIPSGGPIADLTFPPDGEWMSCSDSGAYFRIEDDDGIEPESIWVVFDDDTIRWPDPLIEWSPPHTLSLNLTPFGNGWFDGELHACDILGNPLDPSLSFAFGIDTEKPYLENEYPAAFEASLELDPTVTFNIFDDHSGMRHMPTLLGISVDGSSWSWFSLYDDEFSVAGDTYTLDSTAIPPLHGGDTVSIRVLVHDSVTVCHVNQLDTSWLFYIPVTPPEAELILPESSTISACSQQGIWFSINDSDGIIPQTIRINIGATSYGLTSPNLTWDGEMLRWEPSSDWLHGSYVTGYLASAYDSLLNGLTAPVPFDFYVDLEPPDVVSTSPGEFALVHDTLKEVRLRIEDSPAGVDPSSIEITVNGIPFTVDGTSLIWSSPYLTFVPSMAGPWDIVDTVEFCLSHVADAPDTCGPNEADEFCFTFFVDGRDPFADPPDGAIVACLEQEIRIYLWAPGDIIDSTIEFEINSEYKTIDSAGVSWDGETLSFIPPGPWPDGDSVLCHLINAEGPFGGIPEIWWGFLMDYSAPIIVALSPSSDEIVAEIDPEIEFTLVDSISGLLAGAFELTINGNTYTIEHPALARTVDNFVFSPELGGMHVAGGDTVEVCIHAEDLADPDYCGPNILDTCYVFYIEAGGPEAELISPEELTPYACDSSIVILIEDHNGIDWTTLEISINDENIFYGDSRVTINIDSLIIMPTILSGGTLHIELLALDDSLENSTEGYEWDVVFDFEPPVIAWLYPSPETTLTTVSPTIRSWVSDEVTAWDFDIIPFAPSTISDDTVNITPPLASLYDTLEYCIVACDSAVCSNCDTSCLRFFIDAAPPTADLVLPGDSTTTACDPQRIIIILHDPSGITASGIMAFFGPDTVTLSDARVRLHGDSLIFDPDGPLPSGEMRVGIIHLEDRWGNTLTDFETVFYVVPTPIYIDLLPSPSASSITISPSISATVDSADSAWLLIDGTTYFEGSTGFSFDLIDITLDAELAGLSWTAGDTVSVCAYSANYADLCGPAVAETCWSFYILYSPPNCEILSTECGHWTACRDQNIEFLLTDTEGIDSTTIEFSVNGEAYDIFASSLSFDPITGILEFIPSTDWYGDSLIFCLLAVEDILGATSGDTPLCCTMFLDFEPPEIDVNPPNGSYLPIPIDTFDFTLEDLGSGAVLDSASIEGIWFYLTDEELSFSDYTGLFYFWDMLSVDPPESITVCASASDLTSYCGPNDTTICWHYGLNTTAPILDLISPEDGSITSCADGPLVFTANDPDGIDTNSVQLVLNGETISAPSPLFAFAGDTIRFAPDSFWSHGSELCGTLSVADPLGSVSTPLYFCFTIDTEPPIITSAVPTPSTSVLDTFANIVFVAEDFPAGIDHATPIVLIEGDTATYIWHGDTCVIDRAPFGLCEFDTVDVSVGNLADMAEFCGANVLADTAWSFIIADDDTLPPHVTSISPAVNFSGLPFVITVEIEDTSGIEEASLLWMPADTEIAPHSIAMIELEPGLWATTESLDVDLMALTVIVCATDDDFDCENPLDRSFGCDTFTITLAPLALDELYHSNYPWNPSDEFGQDVCAGEEYSGFLFYTNPETVSIFVNEIIGYGDSVSRIGEWADSLVEPGDTIYFPIYLFADEAGHYSDTLFFYDSRLDYPVAIDTIWANVELCEFRVYPNPFTPNNDGYYDWLVFELPHGRDIEINIYRLEGMRVTTLNDQPGRIYTWDGTDDFGKAQPPGIYLWVIRIDGEIFKHGSVTLAR